MRSRFAILLLSVCATVTAGVPLTAEEQKAVNGVVTNIEAACRSEMAKMSNKAAADAPPLVRMMSDLTQSHDYCGCTARNFGQKITPALLRSGSQEEFSRLAKLSGTECVLPVFKSTFGSYCADLLKEIQPRVTKETMPGPEMCQCVQTEIDQITVDSYEEYVRRTIADYKEYQRTRTIPTSGPSLMARMYSCGLGRVKKKD